MFSIAHKRRGQSPSRSAGTNTRMVNMCVNETIDWTHVNKLCIDITVLVFSLMVGASGLETPYSGACDPAATGYSSDRKSAQWLLLQVSAIQPCLLSFQAHILGRRVVNGCWLWLTSLFENHDHHVISFLQSVL